MRFDPRAVALLFLATLGCADFHRGPAPGDGGTADARDAGLVADYTFEISVYPILELHCGGCHSSTGEGAYTSYVLTGNARNDRAMVMALVTPGDPAASLLIRRATGDAHTGGDVLDQDGADYQTVASWIASLPSP